MTIIIGLDLASHKCGVTVIEHEESMIANLNQIEVPKGSLAERLRWICRDVSRRVVAVRLQNPTAKILVGSESLPTRRARMIGMLGEVRGVVRLGLLESSGLSMEDVPLASGRKLLLGSNYVSKGSKDLAIATVRSIFKNPSLGEDAADSWVTANWLCFSIGGKFVAVP